MHTHKRLIGVLGGMGPAATIDFLAKVVSATPATVDQDHIPLIIHDVPQIPDRSAAIESGEDTPFLPMLSGVRMLDAAGVEYIAIPCNTAHYWCGRLELGCRARILHIADAVAAQLGELDRRPGSIAVMATRGTIAAGIYSQRLNTVMERVVVPGEPAQQMIDMAIGYVKGGNLIAARNAATHAIGLLATEGSEAVLLACTELPVALAGAELKAAIAIDATEALARACVKASLGQFELAKAS